MSTIGAVYLNNAQNLIFHFLYAGSNLAVRRNSRVKSQRGVLSDFESVRFLVSPKMLVPVPDISAISASPVT